MQCVADQQCDMSTSYTFEAATDTLISSTPLLRDAYEHALVYSQPSTVPDADEGT